MREALWSAARAAPLRYSFDWGDLAARAKEQTKFMRAPTLLLNRNAFPHSLIATILVDPLPSLFSLNRLQFVHPSQQKRAQAPRLISGPALAFPASPLPA